MRQLWDAKGSAQVELMEPDLMASYARLCATELARAHVRSGDGVAIASYLGGADTFDRSLALFAEAYADQNERDYKTLTDAVERREDHGRNRSVGWAKQLAAPPANTPSPRPLDDVFSFEIRRRVRRLGGF